MPKGWKPHNYRAPWLCMELHNSNSGAPYLRIMKLYKWDWFMELHKWIMGLHKLIMELHNSFMELHNSFMELHNSIVGLHKWIVEFHKWIVESRMLSFHLQIFVGYLTQNKYTKFDQITDVLIYQGTISSGGVFVWSVRSPFKHAPIRCKYLGQQTVSCS